MSNLHPHWESEGAEVPVSVKNAIPEHAKTVSRQPAAIVGMVTVLAIGYIFFQGVESLTGQVSSGDQQKSVSITEEGLSPVTLEVEHGQTIVWTNNQAIPHILESQELCSDTGYCLQTKTLFQGESDNFTITLDMPAGSYNYTSATSSDIQGVIVITTTAADDFQDLTSLFDTEIFGNEQQQGGNDVNTTTPPPSSPFDTPAPTPVAAPSGSNIPQNPYTADSVRIHPFDGDGNPIESAFGDAPNTAPAPTSFSNSGPTRQPETGAGGIVFMVLGSIAALWFATKHCFNKTYQF